jgi:hypothetical protein
VDPLSSRDPLGSFVTHLCLVYHEARNVRHLIEKGLRPEGPYAQLRLLPRNRDQAWAVMQDLRIEARRRGSARAAANVLARRFGLSLEDLVELYEDKNWKDAQSVGGYPWLKITRSVIELRDALDRNDERLVERLLAAIPDMSHNTGRVEEKLRGLDAAIDRSGIDSNEPIRRWDALEQ